MKENDSREVALERERHTVELAKKISSLFPQIPSELEFIQAMSEDIPDSEAASLIWHTLTDYDNALSILYGPKKLVNCR